MIVLHLMGGLSNQMFQYAAAYRLAKKRSTNIKFDLEVFQQGPEIDTPRHYELDCFGIKPTPANSADLAEFNLQPDMRKFWFRLKRKLTKIQPRLAAWQPNFVFVEGGRFDPRLLYCPQKTYINGWCQSDLYFNDIADEVRRLFTFVSPAKGKNSQHLEWIKKTNSVSLHIRRGDYVSNQYANQFHGLLPMNYYKTAVNEILKQVPDAHFFVISNDPQWSKQHLKLAAPATFIDNNPDDTKGFEDMRLMSNCKHHIMANSSFSWWGSWLSPQPGGIVYAPKQWFKDKSVSSKEMILPDWIQL